jgi:hypothetical protein
VPEGSFGFSSTSKCALTREVLRSWRFTPHDPPTRTVVYWTLQMTSRTLGP